MKALEKLYIIILAIGGICVGLTGIGLGLLLLIHAVGSSALLMFTLIPLSVVCFLLGAVIIVVTIFIACCYIFPE